MNTYGFKDLLKSEEKQEADKRTAINIKKLRESFRRSEERAMFKADNSFQRKKINDFSINLFYPITKVLWNSLGYALVAKERFSFFQQYKEITGNDILFWEIKLNGMSDNLRIVFKIEEDSNGDGLATLMLQCVNKYEHSSEEVEYVTINETVVYDPDLDVDPNCTEKILKEEVMMSKCDKEDYLYGIGMETLSGAYKAISEAEKDIIKYSSALEEIIVDKIVIILNLNEETSSQKDADQYFFSTYKEGIINVIPPRELVEDVNEDKGKDMNEDLDWFS